MSIDVRVYDNGDHTAIIWLPKDGRPIAGCRGFAIQRTHHGQNGYLHGFVGFSPDQTADAPWKWPLQRYMWWDYHVQPGDTVKYQVIPVSGNASNLQLQTDQASQWTQEMTVSGQCTKNISAYFNKGIVAAQWVSRELDQEAQGKNRQSALKDIIAKTGDPLRDALAGLLKTEIVQLLKKAGGGQLFAALYELNDPELEDLLTAMKGSANVILANGSFTSQSPDENQDARDKLKKAGVHVFDRMVTQGHFAHNKFAVICDNAGNAQRVLTGSTNWTMSGLCTQANNGLIINDAAVADCYLQEWHRLQKAGNDFPADLKAANSQLKQFKVDDVQTTVWFAPTLKAQDLEYARKLIASAKEGALFLFFNPGTYQEDTEKETLLQDVLQRHNPKSPDYNANLYIRGVVNQEIANLAGGPSLAKGAPVMLFDGGKNEPQTRTKDVLVPANIKQKFANWEDEALRATLVMVHSKVVVLDPFGEHPVVMTGSHNLGLKASQKNDDNLVILEGPAAAPLAAAYAVNIIGIYQTYRWNTYVTGNQANKNAWKGLEDDDKWQAGHLAGDNLAELKFWMSEHLEAEAHIAAAAGQAHPAAPAAKPRIKTARTPKGSQHLQ